MRTSFPGQVLSAARCRVEIVRKRATQTTPCTSFKVLMKSQSRPAEGAAHMQKLHQTAQITLPLHLNASTTTKPDAKLPTVGPVDITLVFPRSGQCKLALL